jgi:uncharacterized pyridoxamine 5'-phosphate oxidase family protein/Pyruvate/2-oxoacid:ferredoxin oxidoreductase delta subunit
MYNPSPALGLNPQSSNEEIKQKAFDFAIDVGHMVFGTTAIDGKTPTSRVLEVHKLDEQGNIYIGISRGKPMYAELMKSPQVVGCIARLTVNRLAVSVRISASVREVDDTAIRERYWAQNPGTKALYHKDLDNFQIFVLESGDGEIFHIPQDNVTVRLRFSFGDGVARKPYYMINENCTGCGICYEKCLTDALIPGERYSIDYFHCLECGNCYYNCPNSAVSQTEY